ncbi:MAG: hypothetical protein HY240_07055 [Actinobacteria bacterium]|nr:hypothetical protein [Actinomycetota bacterium]
MTLLRRVLYYQAAVWTGCGAAIAIAPRWVLMTLFDQAPSPDYGYVRVSGAMSVGLALVMVLVAQRIEDVWWWSWAFALTDAAIVTITALHALFGLPAGSGSLLWWLFAGTNLALGAGLLVGMARAGHEKPFA